MKKTVLLVLFAIGLALTGISFVTAADAFADDAGVTAVDAGVGSSSPAEQLDDPVTNPGAAFDDAKATYKIGWPIFLLACLLILAKGLLTAGKRWKWKWLAWLNTGARAFVIASVITVGSAAFDVLALGGTVGAAGLATVGAIIALFAPTPKNRQADNAALA